MREPMLSGEISGDEESAPIIRSALDVKRFSKQEIQQRLWIFIGLGWFSHVLEHPHTTPSMLFAITQVTEPDNWRMARIDGHPNFPKWGNYWLLLRGWRGRGSTYISSVGQAMNPNTTTRTLWKIWQKDKNNPSQACEHLLVHPSFPIGRLSEEEKQYYMCYLIRNPSFPMTTLNEYPNRNEGWWLSALCDRTDTPPELFEKWLQEGLDGQIADLEALLFNHQCPMEARDRIAKKFPTYEMFSSRITVEDVRRYAKGKTPESTLFFITRNKHFSTRVLYEMFRICLTLEPGESRTQYLTEILAHPNCSHELQVSILSTENLWIYTRISSLYALNVAANASKWEELWSVIGDIDTPDALIPLARFRAQEIIDFIDSDDEEKEFARGSIDKICAFRKRYFGEEVPLSRREQRIHKKSAIKVSKLRFEAEKKAAILRRL